MDSDLLKTVAAGVLVWLIIAQIRQMGIMDGDDADAEPASFDSVPSDAADEIASELLV